MTARSVLATKHMTEDELLRNVLNLCSHLPLLAAHFRPARTDKGWRTAVAGDGKGYPDLTIIGAGGVRFRELKSERGRLEPPQMVWRDKLLAAGEDWALWRPSDWMSGRIERELKALAKGDAHA